MKEDASKEKELVDSELDSGDKDDGLSGKRCESETKEPITHLPYGWISQMFYRGTVHYLV